MHPSPFSPARRPTRRRRAGFVLAALAGGAFAGCPAAPPAPPADAPAADWFEDATARLGVAFVHDPGPAADYSTHRIMGSGCAIFDADGDGRPDLLFLQGGGAGTNALYRQTEPGTFTNVSAGSGLDFAGPNTGVAVGDADGDGRPDVLVTRPGGLRLLRNLGGLKFEDISAAAGLASPNWGTSAAFFDYDRDGRLDLVVANYVEIDAGWPCAGPDGAREFCGPAQFPDAGKPARLFHNAGPAGGAAVTFTDVSLASGVGKLAAPGLGVYCADLTGDGWPDIFVANDTGPNRLWVNRADGTFADEGAARGVAFNGMGQTAANMGVAVGDVDNDGLTDLFVTHLTSEMNTLWKQGPRGVFRDRTLAAGAVATKWRGTGFGTLMADFDRDGRADLAIANGRVARGDRQPNALPEFWRDYAERNQLLRNAGGKFEDVSAANPVFSGPPNVGRGLAVGDLDRDGRPDLVVTAVAGPAKVYLNRAAPDKHWLAVVPLARTGGPAHGAEVAVVAGGVRQVRTVQPAESYLSSSDPEALFGLGDAAAVESVTVTWPDGRVESVPAGPADRRVVVRQGK